MKKLRTAVVGVGYLGRFHAQKYKSIAESDLIAVCDTNDQRAREIAQEIGTAAVTKPQDLIGKVDAVSIVADTSVHYELTKMFLESGIHVLVEKPIASSSAEARDLVSLAQRKSLVLQVGHIERFNPAFEAARKKVKLPGFVETHRQAPYGPRSNSKVDVVMDLMIHDLDLVLSLDPTPVRSILATGKKIITPLYDFASARLQFESGMVAQLNVSRLAPAVFRRMQILQKDLSLTVDFTLPSLSLVTYPSLTIENQNFEKTDALMVEIQNFVHSVLGLSQPRVTGQNGLDALRLAELVLESINQSQV